MTVSYIETESALTVVIAETGKIYNIDNTHPNWERVRQNLYAEEYEGLEELLSVKKTVETFFSATSAVGIEIDDSGVKYNGTYIENYLTKKILDFASRGLPTKALVNFFEKVMQNPSKRAVDELYKFLEHGQMPITPSGNFLGYKSVTRNYNDWYSGKFDNSVGQVLEMPRNQVCDDPDQGCSYGFHVGTLEYATNFNSNNRVVIVEVSPADVVSVPHDCNHQKLRTAKYTVVGEFDKPLDNDYSDEYNTEEEEEEEADERTIEDVEREIDNIKDNLVRYSHCLTPSEIIALGEELEGLEEELEAFEDDDEEDDDTTSYGGSDIAPPRDEKGRFCKRNS